MLAKNVGTTNQFMDHVAAVVGRIAIVSSISFVDWVIIEVMHIARLKTIASDFSFQ